MGVNLGDLFSAHPVPEGWYHGKRIAVDGHNVAFRYLTSYLGKGDMLRNAEGMPIGHLIGYLNLVRHLREEGAEPVVVWDGDVHPRKRATVEARVRRRIEAGERLEQALATGDEAAAMRHLRASVYLDGTMIRAATEVLEALGVAVVRADYDGERYAAAMCRAGHADAVATEDFDALVAGAPVVLRKAGSRDPFLHLRSDLDGHGLTADQLRWIAIFCGTDWHPGVRGLGPKTALKLVREHSDVAALVREASRGAGDSRIHRLLRESGLQETEFRDLDAFIAELPEVRPSQPKAPDVAVACDLADKYGLDRKRTMACFC